MVHIVFELDPLIRFRIAAAALLLCLSAMANADLRVFTCEPEWEALVREIGGEAVTAHSATNALQDPHYIEARPSLIAKVRRADLLICSGAQLEIGWLPMLINKANNRDVLPGSEGFIEASALVRRLEVPVSIDRSQGDMHPQGNPHVQVNPHNILIIAGVLADRMAMLDPERAAYYQARAADFLSRWKAAIEFWEERARGLAGKRVVTHHKSWVYLADWLSLEEIAHLEPVPGIPPTASHLSRLLEQLGSDGGGADFIIRSPYQSAKASKWLAERTGITSVMLPLTVGGTEQARDLFSLFDDLLDRLLGETP